MGDIYKDYCENVRDEPRETSKARPTSPYMDRPAFPVAEDHKTADSLAWTAGLTIRDYRAGVVAGLLLAELARRSSHGLVGEDVRTVARTAYALADAMIDESKRPPSSRELS